MAESISLCRQILLIFVLYVFSHRLVKQKLKKRKRGKKQVELKPRWEDDYELVENEGLFAEYLEMGELIHDIQQCSLGDG